MHILFPAFKIDFGCHGKRFLCTVCLCLSVCVFEDLFLILSLPAITASGFFSKDVKKKVTAFMLYLDTVLRRVKLSVHVCYL